MTAEVLPQTAGAWHRRIWQLTWPVILANITIPMVGVADVAVMGRLPDPAYIGAVAMGAAMFSAVYWLFGFLRMGTTGLASQAFGRGDAGEIGEIFIRGLCVAAVLGLTIVLLQWPLAAMLFALFDASSQVANLAATYYDIRVYGAPALLIYLVELGVLFGLQRMRDTLLLSIALNVTNLGLDILLVVGLEMGVAGVALGTVISEWGAAAAGLWLVWRSLHAVGYSGRPAIDLWRIDAVRGLFHVSSNLVLRTFFVQLPFFAGTVVATRLGDTTLAAHGVLMQLFFVMTYSLDGFAHTAETLAGFAFGAKNRVALRHTTIYSAMWAMLLALATATLYWVAGDVFVAWLTLDANIRVAASAYLPWLAAAPLLCVWAFLFDGIFIGTTHIVEMRNAMFAAAAVWAVCLWATLASLGYHAIWLTMSIFMLVRSVLLALYYPRLEHGADTQAG
jgi:MATE family multidrug resistance protein